MKLNNKGYMIIEIIMASMITFGIAYFLLDLTVNLKNKSDNIRSESFIMADKAIIENYIVKELKSSSEIGADIDCIDSGNIVRYKKTTDPSEPYSYIELRAGDKNNYLVGYQGKNIINYTKKPNAYVDFKDFSCSNNGDKLNITIYINDKFNGTSYNINLNFVL